VVALFVLQPGAQRARRGLGGVTEVTRQAEIGHDRWKPRVEALAAHAHHMKLAAGQPVLGDAVGVKSGEIIARTHHNRLSLDGPAARLQARRGSMPHAGLAPERHAISLRQSCGKSGNGIARFHPDLMRTIKRSGKFMRAKPGSVSGNLRRLR
jgi:hypothetical protein